ncbi:acyl-CoA synthetase [Dyella terrae]|nr:acyl-CoA synthetase [Dyella terrae]
MTTSERHDGEGMREPRVLGVQSDGSTCTLDLHLPRELAWFAGHFRDFPVLPGVVQLQWALAFGARHLGTPEACRQLEMLKFQRLLRPEDRVQLHLIWHVERRRLQFAYRQGELEFASGRFAWSQDHD